MDASRRTVRWWASVARALRLRKKKYWMIMGARARKDEADEADFSIRAHVR